MTLWQIFFANQNNPTKNKSNDFFSRLRRGWGEVVREILDRDTLWVDVSMSKMVVLPQHTGQAYSTGWSDHVATQPPLGGPHVLPLFWTEWGKHVPRAHMDVCDPLIIAVHPHLVP